MRAMASFRLHGRRPEQTAQRVTAHLGVAPSTAFEAGTPIGRRTPRLRDQSTWILESAAGPVAGTELATHLRRLFVLLEPVTTQLWELADEGYWANWFCYLGSSATEHAAELDRDILSRLLKLPGDLWLDVSEDELADGAAGLPGDART